MRNTKENILKLVERLEENARVCVKIDEEFGHDSKQDAGRMMAFSEVAMFFRNEKYFNDIWDIMNN